MSVRTAAGIRSLVHYFIPSLSVLYERSAPHSASCCHRAVQVTKKITKNFGRWAEQFYICNLRNGGTDFNRTKCILQMLLWRTIIKKHFARHPL